MRIATAELLILFNESIPPVEAIIPYNGFSLMPSCRSKKLALIAPLTTLFAHGFLWRA